MPEISANAPTTFSTSAAGFQAFSNPATAVYIAGMLAAATFHSSPAVTFATAAIATGAVSHLVVILLITSLICL